MKVPKGGCAINYYATLPGLEMLEQFGEVVQAYGMSQEELCAKISSCDALIVRSGTKV